MTPRFIGLDNYRELWGDDDFHRALLNTLYYLVGYLPLVMVGGLGLALLVNSKLKGVAMFRAMYFLPVVTSWVVVALLWKWLLNPSDGLVNWAARPGRHRRTRLVDVADVGDAVGDPGVGVEGPRVRDDHPARRSAVDRRDAVRGGEDRRGRGVAAAAVDHDPDADAVVVLRRR